jgi:hypothetical protein
VNISCRAFDKLLNGLWNVDSMFERRKILELCSNVSWNTC